MQNEYYSFCKQLERCPSTNYAMSRKERGFKMGIGKAGRILAPTLFVLNLPVALARAPGKIAFGSRGKVEDFAWVDVGQCNDGRVSRR
jgi:hypothetical protein